MNKIKEEDIDVNFRSLQLDEEGTPIEISATFKNKTRWYKIKTIPKGRYITINKKRHYIFVRN